nr:MAG TPA: hypothetical protein [Bacteriophage sp.]
MDIINALTPKNDMYLCGTYYETLPNEYNLPDGSAADKNNAVGGIPFKYNTIDERAVTHTTLEEIEYHGSRLTIETRAKIGFKISKNVVTQDGRLWSIEELREKTDKKATLRFQKVAPDTKYVLSLLEVANPWGLDD